MPIEAQQIHRRIAVYEGIGEAGARRKDQNQEDTDRNVESVNAGHQPVDVEK
jgi:hypothetical protein